MNVVEYIGGEGVRTTPHVRYRSRLQQVRPGDVVDVSHLTHYPFGGQDVARVDVVRDSEVHLCLSGGSVFWTAADSVLISGGPFRWVRLDQLEPTWSTRVVRFWNWGDNGPGADHGVEYHVQRPVFRLSISDA